MPHVQHGADGVALDVQGGVHQREVLADVRKAEEGGDAPRDDGHDEVCRAVSGEEGLVPVG